MIKNIGFRAFVIFVALLSGCISSNLPSDPANAENEAEDIVRTISSWLEPYQARSEVTTMQDGSTTYLYGSFGALQSVFSTFHITFAVDADEREVVCYGYLKKYIST